MEKFEVFSSTVAQEKLAEWAAPIVEIAFPKASYWEPAADGRSINICCGYDEGNTFVPPSENRLNKLCDEMNRYFKTVHASPFAYDYGEAIPAGITIEPIEFWNDTIEELDRNTFQFIRKSAICNRIPFDIKLREKIRFNKIDIEYARNNLEDGFGIAGEYKTHKIDFTIECVAYADNDGNPDDPDWVYDMVPDIWYYGGTVDGKHFEGLASTDTLAIGKAMEVIYHIAKKHLPQAAQALEGNLFKWRQYGFTR